MIEVRHLTKRYEDHTAVKDLSFTVEGGSIYGFLGPNGAGKSTTMNIMTGYLSPTEGEVIIDGVDLLEEPEKAKRKIGYLPETPPVYPDLTTEEYLRFAAELKGIPRARRKECVENVLSALGLEEMRRRLIRHLSKGFRQRVGLAQALLGDPEILILDEPTVGLDPKQILEMRELIRSLGKKHTVILSSHILSEVEEICDKVLIMAEGRVAACDTPENLSKAAGRAVRIHVAAEGGREAVLAALRTVAAVEEDEVSVDGAVTTAEIHVPGGEDLRSSISGALFAAGCPVVELSLEKADLENIFLKLTEKSRENSGNDGEELQGESGDDGEELQGESGDRGKKSLEVSWDDGEEPRDNGKEAL